MSGGVFDGLLGASPGRIVVGRGRLTGEEAHDRGAQGCGGVDVLAQLERGCRVAEEGGLSGVSDQEPGISDAAGRFRQFDVEPGPCFPTQLEAVGTGLEGDIDEFPDGTLAAL